MAIKRIYNHKVFFKLIINGTVHFINEPVKWDGVEADFPRDKDYFGFVVDSFDDTIEIGFGCDDIAYELIRNAYDQFGGDAEIIFQYGYYEPNTTIERTPFSGVLNMNLYKKQLDQIIVSIEKQSFKNLFRTRFETVVDLSSSVDLDGNLIPPAPIYNVNLHSKAIIKQLLTEVTEPQEVNSGVISRSFSVKMDSSYEVTSELSGNQQIPLSVNGIDPVDQSLYFFKAAEAGTYDMKFSAKFELQISRPDFAGKVGNYSSRPRIKIQRAGVVIEELMFNTFQSSGNANSKDVTFQVNFQIDISRTLQIGDNVYLDYFGGTQYEGAPYVYFVRNYTNKNQITAQTSAATSSSKCYRLFDVLNYLIGATTGNQDALISEILSPGGACYDYIVANGYQVRNFLTTDKPLKLSLKDFFDAFFSVFGFGYGFKNISGKDFIEVEEFQKFFNPTPIINIDESFDIHGFSTEHRKSDVYNELEIGFEKFPEDDTNTLDEFNTYSTSLTPIKKYKSKFIKKSKAITSGYLIEEQRREQFQENPSTSLTNDDELFLISVIETYGVLYSERNENFTNINGILDPASVYNLRLSLARIRYNWSPFLNIGFTKKLNTDVIKTTFIKNNDKLESALKPTDTRRRYEPGTIIDENGDITIGVFRADNRGAIHESEEFNFSCVLNYDEYELVKTCLEGNSSSSANHGCIAHLDDENVMWLSHVYAMKYRFPTGETVFQVAKIKPYVPAVIPPVVLPPEPPTPPVEVRLNYYSGGSDGGNRVSSRFILKINGTIYIESTTYLNDFVNVFVGDSIEVENKSDFDPTVPTATLTLNCAKGNNQFFSETIPSNTQDSVKTSFEIENAGEYNINSFFMIN